jgi:hypothetical protein
MGTDIHGVFQKRTENGWQDIPHNYDEGRHYTLFAWLGNVRNGSSFSVSHDLLEPLTDCRDYPDDFIVDEDQHPIDSFDVIAKWRQGYRTPDDDLSVWMGEHSHSWASADEILNTTPPKIMQRGIVTREFFDQWDGITPPDGWCGGIGGGGIVVNTAAEVKDDTTHVVIEWEQDLAEEFKYFIDEVRRLKELHGEVRFVFGFDS